MEGCPIGETIKRYGRPIAYLFDPIYVDFEIRQSLTSELKEDPKTIGKIIERVTAKHYLDKSKRENDWGLVGLCIGSIWGSVYGHDSIGKVTPVCIPDYIPSLIELVTSTQLMKKSKGLCGSRYYVNPEELLFLCTHNKESEFGPFERLDVFYEGPEDIGTKPSSLCDNMLEIVDKDSARILSLDEIVDFLSKKLNIGIVDYEKKAEIVRSKLFP